MTNKQRAERFANAAKPKGLKSKGNEGLSIEEQKSLLDCLETAGDLSSQQFLQLRSLRESALASCTDLSAAIFKLSIKQGIKGNRPEVLSALCHLIDDIHPKCPQADIDYYRVLYVLALYPVDAEKACDEWLGVQNDRIGYFLQAAATRDLGLFQSLLLSEPDIYSKTLMGRLIPRLQATLDAAQRSFRPLGSGPLLVSFPGKGPC